MIDKTIADLVVQTVYYSIANSFVVFGILKTIKTMADVEKLNRFISVGITYVIGIIMGFMIWGDIPIWQKVLHGFFIGSTSVAVYESATKSLLEIIPILVKKFFKSEE